jgi:hypothetical protein
VAKTEDKTLRTWPLNVDLDDAHRIAEYLYKAGKKFPGRPIPITYIVRVAVAMPTVPRESNKAVEAFRSSNRMSRVREILFNEYKAGLVYVRGVGYRVSVDSNDVIDTLAEGRARRARNAIKSLEKTMGLVKPSEVTGKERKTRFRELSQVTGFLTSDDVQDKLIKADNNEE